ncbi:MAG: type IV toxin-antitoxin system AbiEi family antitoxin domain-containing protein [Solirubrobacteraceae bacterium]|jgi:predicted transcriptional regulator of viral defense system
MPGRVFTELAEIAGEQHGYVTTDDAAAHGIAPINLSRMAQRRVLERRATGVYRLPLTPPGPLDAYVEATLWPQRGVRGVLSHETALELYELSDVNPAKIHLTLPAGYRVRRQVPAAYRLHHEDLDPAAVTLFEGIPIVAPAHAIRQAAAAHLGDALLAQAIDHGERNGRLTRREAAQLRRELGVRRGGGMRR